MMIRVVNNETDRLLETSLAENIALRRAMEQDQQAHHDGALKTLLEKLLQQAKEERESMDADDLTNSSTPTLSIEESFKQVPSLVGHLHGQNDDGRVAGAFVGQGAVKQ